jgi:transcriptional regulator with XRE-family HTH domain
MIFPVQIRAARALLGMSQSELADRALVSVATVKRFEALQNELLGTISTIASMKRVLEEDGVIFIEQDETNGPGVRLRERLP